MGKRTVAGIGVDDATGTVQVRTTNPEMPKGITRVETYNPNGSMSLHNEQAGRTEPVGAKVNLDEHRRLSKIEGAVGPDGNKTTLTVDRDPRTGAVRGIQTGDSANQYVNLQGTEGKQTKVSFDQNSFDLSISKGHTPNQPGDNERIANPDRTRTTYRALGDTQPKEAKESGPSPLRVESGTAPVPNQGRQ